MRFLWLYFSLITKAHEIIQDINKGRTFRAALVTSVSLIFRYQSYGFSVG